jgi:hypothetical protein
VSVHPEGERYAHNNREIGNSLVTDSEAHVTDYGVAEQSENCFAMVQTFDALSNLAAPATISGSGTTYSPLQTANTGAHPNDLFRHEFVLRARSDSLSFQQHPFPSQHCRDPFSRYYSKPVILRAVAAQAESSHSSFSSSTEAQNRRRRRRSSQRGFTPVLPFPNYATFSASGGTSTVDSSWAYCLAEPLQGATAAVLIRGEYASL